MTTNKGKPVETEEDPFEDYEPPAPAGQVKLNSVGDWVKIKVSEVGEPFDAEFGPVFVISGTLLRSGGPTVEAPGNGEECGYMIGWEKANGKPAHVREEIQKAVKAAGRRDGSLRDGDIIAVKFAEEVTHSKANKKFANPFRQHAVRVVELTATPENDSEPPW